MAFAAHYFYLRALCFYATRVFLLTTALLLATIPALQHPAHAAIFSPPSPTARIIYSADTFGYLHPCSTCGEKAQGGIARRAALIAKLKNETPSSLIIAGPNEFYDDRGIVDENMAARLMPVFHAALARIPHTAVYASPKATSRMEKNGLANVPSVVAVTDRPVTKIFRVGRIVAACIFFPSGEGEKSAPSKEQVLAVQRAAKDATAKAGLVIGISPWGMYAENALMPSLAGYFHLVLGGGPGIAVPGQATGTQDAPGPLWVRSDRRGRAVNVLDIFSEPGSLSGAWLDGIHFSSRLEFLEPSMPQDREVAKIVAAFPKDAE